MSRRSDIIDSNQLSQWLIARGAKLKSQGKEFMTNSCPIADHKSSHLCVSVNDEKKVWHCNDHEKGGTIIEWITLKENVTPEIAMARFPGGHEKRSGSPPPTNIVARYDYTDERGNLLYQVVRFEPKDFRQRRPDGIGGWKWNLEGVTRMLYRLPEVLGAKRVFVVEGEKDVETLRKVGLVATSNVGGANKWLPSYADCLKGKAVIVIPDNDPKGREHGDAVVESLADKATSVKCFGVPSPHKDVSDFFAAFEKPEDGLAILEEMIAQAPDCIDAVPAYSVGELEERYRAFVRRSHEAALHLNRFLPSFSKFIRPVMPGELVVVLSDTGVGKTCLLQHIARAATPTKVLMFEMELPPELMFERFAQMQTGATAAQVEEEYRFSDVSNIALYEGLSHLWICPEPGLSPDQIESITQRSELKIGSQPGLILVDYIGLTRMPGKSRYEAVSYAAEQLKIIAQRRMLVCVVASQIGRKSERKREDEKNIEVTLHEAKDSGSIENSAQLLIGAWRPDRSTLMLRVLKNSKGKTGGTIQCNFDGERMRITERDNWEDK